MTHEQLTDRIFQLLNGLSNNQIYDVIDLVDEYINALGKYTNVPTNSALDHIHNVVRDDAYRRGYEHGKADAPGEAHWIKSYTPDDGEIYECDNCGVTWFFDDGGPEENEAYYCPKCGFKMVPKGEQNETD